MFQTSKNTCKSALGINPFFYSPPIFKWEAGLKNISVELTEVTDDKRRIILEKNTSCGAASVMANRYVKRSDTKKPQNCDFFVSYGRSVCQVLPSGNFTEIEFTE